MDEFRRDRRQRDPQPADASGVEGSHARLEGRLAASTTHGEDSHRRVRLQRLGRVLTRRSALALAVAAAALVVGAVAGARLAGPSRGATPPVPVFRPTLGWNTFEANVGDAPLPVAFAANVPFQPPDISSPDIPPTATLKSLPANGIVIAVGGPWAYTGDETPPRLQFPLQLSQLYFLSNNYEGQPAPSVSTYEISGLVDSTQNVEVFVWMGTNHPTQDMIKAANEELDQLQMPS